MISIDNRWEWKPYIFFRKDGWYIVDLPNDEEVIPNVECNPGTLRVEDANGKVLWQQGLIN